MQSSGSSPAELANVVFQGVITVGLAAFAGVLYRRVRERWFAWWAAAWGFYALRITAIVVFLQTGNLVWLFWHQVATGWVALAILWAALVFSRGAKWKWWYAALVLFPPALAFVAVRAMDQFMLVAAPMVALISGATLWTGWVFWRYAQRSGSDGARFVAITFALWGLHHLDYPFLRARGAWVPWGYYLDILFELSVGIGFGLLVLSDLANRLGNRTDELARLSALMVRQHEAERRRLSRELHDETAQTLSAVKLEIGMLREGVASGHGERLDHVLHLVDDGIRGIRRVMNDLRPALLDDLGLIPAIRSLADDVNARGPLAVETVLPDSIPDLSAELELAVFRAAQEALSNVVRHASASRAWLRIDLVEHQLRLEVTDNGRGLAETASGPSGFGIAGLRERIAAFGGTVDVSDASDRGTTVVVIVSVAG